MNRSKQKGTAWETAIVNYAKPVLSGAERLPLAGANDIGDVRLVAGIHAEAKNCATLKLAEWVDEAVREGKNFGGLCVAWIKRRGKSSPGDGYVVMTGRDFLDLVIAVEYARNLSADVVAEAIRKKAA